jgi:serine phosphatase RsbU (regulator of sigma subunit)
VALHAGADAATILNAIIASLQQFQDQVTAEDDITLIVVKVTAEF